MANIFKKIIEAGEVALDSYIEKARTNGAEEGAYERKGFIEIDTYNQMQYGYKERVGLVGPQVLKTMSRRDSIVSAIIKTRLNQVSEFAQPQQDKYSPGFKIVPRKPADLSSEDKLKLADPELSEEEYDSLKYELEQKRSELSEKQEKDIQKGMDFILHCGMPTDEADTTHKRWDFDKFIKVITRDRLTYNYAAIETIPTKDRSRLHHFYPVSAGTIRYVARKSGTKNIKDINPFLNQKDVNNPLLNPVKYKDTPQEEPYKYVQVVRGKIVAAWTEKELVFEPGEPTVDPEDNGYAMGELETLIQIITSHLYAEAHNRNFFTQGIGTKGILHIKGDNMSRAQLEAFKRQWMNQVTNSRNAFRPPIIGMADDVKWVALAQSNREMEFEQWMNYLIRITCAVYQIDPAEINFDISKINTSTLNESSNEARLKSSKDRGLKPLLSFLENIVNHHILRFWDSDWADRYEFKFVGLDAETRQQEQERLSKEVEIWKTINEARIEMGFPPMEDGDIILNGAFTQYKQLRMQMEQETQAAGEMPQDDQQQQEPESSPDADSLNEAQDLSNDIDQIIKEVEDESKASSNEKEKPKEEKPKEEKTKKSQPTVIEYYHTDEDDDE